MSDNLNQIYDRLGRIEAMVEEIKDQLPTVQKDVREVVLWKERATARLTGVAAIVAILAPKAAAWLFSALNPNDR